MNGKIAACFVSMVFAWMLIGIGAGTMAFWLMGLRSETFSLALGAGVYAGGLFQSLRWLNRVAPNGN